MNLDCQELTQKHLVNIHMLTKHIKESQSLNNFQQTSKTEFIKQRGDCIEKKHSLSETSAFVYFA